MLSMIVLAPTLITKPQSPFSNLFQKVPSKLMMCKRHPTLRWGEKVVTKYHPTISVIVKKPTSYARSQCLYLCPLLATSYDPNLLTMYSSKQPPNVLYYISNTPQIVIRVDLFLLGFTSMVAMQSTTLSKENKGS